MLLKPLAIFAVLPLIFSLAVTARAEVPSRVVEKPVYGVSIDNSGRARPQSGLARASRIYEFEVEGRITRYLALFNELPPKVGPIRSARIHSTMLALENDINFVYGSANWFVLEVIDEWALEWNLKHTNALTMEKPGFWRDPARPKPHNLYVNLITLDNALEEAPRGTIVRPLYLSRRGEPVSVISLEYSPILQIRYIYCPDIYPETKTYRRYINDQLHKDACGTPIRVRNIIIQHVPHTVCKLGHPKADLIGEGKIDFYSQGYHFQGTWKKENLKTPTRFYFQDGQEIDLPYGQT